MIDSIMITVSSTNIIKYGIPYNNSISFSSNLKLELETLCKMLLNLFSQEDIDKIGEERIILTIEPEKVGFFIESILMPYLEKEMASRKTIPKRHWTILKVSDDIWGYFNLRENDDALVSTFYSIYKIAKIAIEKNRLLYIYSLPYDEHKFGINKED
jgi:hypothetical protein